MTPQKSAVSRATVGKTDTFPGKKLRARRKTRTVDVWEERRSHYRQATAFIMNDGNHREPGAFKVLKNYAPTVIDGWLDANVFGPHEVRVISLCRDYWHADALGKIWAMRSRVPLWKWWIFENVVRWNEPTGVLGSRIAKGSTNSTECAKRIVAEVARSIA